MQVVFLIKGRLAFLLVTDLCIIKRSCLKSNSLPGRRYSEKIIITDIQYFPTFRLTGYFKKLDF